MTKDVTDLLHEEAGRIDPAHFDSEALMGAGNRRIRRRRTTWSVGLASAAVLAAVAIPAAGNWGNGGGPADGPSGQPAAATDPLGAALANSEVSYAVGTTVHVGQQKLDVGREIQAYVQTPQGVVFTDGTGGVFSADGDKIERVGNTDKKYPSLLWDDTLVAWVDPSGDRPEFAAYDQATGKVTQDPLQTEPGMDHLRDTQNPAVVYAVDGDVVYVRDSRGAVAWNVETDEQEVLSTKADGFAIESVANGKIAYQRPVSPDPDFIDPGDSDRVTESVVGPNMTDGTVLPGSWTTSLLSENGDYALGESEPDEMALWDSTTGQQLPKLKTDHDFVVGYRWESEQTFLALGLNKPWGSKPTHILRCTVNQSCEVAVDSLPADLNTMAVPMGETLDN